MYLAPRWLLLIALLLFVPQISYGQQAEIEQPILQWLTDRGEHPVSDADGIGVPGHPLRIKATVYGVTPQKKGGFSTEVEIRVRVAPGKEILDYVAGAGRDQSAAMQLAVKNFVNSTLPVCTKASSIPTTPTRSCAT